MAQTNDIMMQKRPIHMKRDMEKRYYLPGHMGGADKRHACGKSREYKGKNQ